MQGSTTLKYMYNKCNDFPICNGLENKGVCRELAVVKGGS